MKLVPKIVAIPFLSLLISACVEEPKDATFNPDTTSADSKMTISGSVGDGPIIGAAISIKNSQGTILATTLSDEQANYRLTLDIQNEDFPLLVESSNGLDLVTGTTPDFALVSVVPDISTTQANLNPHSTLIVKTASQMPGGLNETNLKQAKDTVLTKLNFGLDTELVNDPITTSIDETNVVTITHSSEALAEMVRRTSSVVGDGTDEDQTLDYLAADLTDGEFDGKGVTGTNPRQTAVSHIVGLQVLIEAMLQDLHVNGVSADYALTAAINSIIESSSKRYSEDRSTKINRLMLRQARAALAGIQVIDPSVTLMDLNKVLIELGREATTEEMIDALIQYGLDLSIATSLDDSIRETVNSSEEEINAINEAAKKYHDEDTDTTPRENTIPSISGTPASSVAEGSSYSFTPVANDPDGDTLRFSIVNQPDWASFNRSNGTLAGTPGFDDAGVYSNITITVSDGSASAMLDSFSITVANTDENPTPEPGAPTLTTARLAGTSAVLAWTQANTTPEGGYDILIDGVDTNSLHRTTALASTIPGLNTSVSHCFAVQARYTDSNLFLVSNELCTDAITPVNTAPTINGSPTLSLAEGEAYLFIPNAADADGETLSFSIANRPTWAAFNTHTGALTGTPGYDNAGTYNNVTISVSDGKISTALNPFSITVTETNQTPTISGSPATRVAEGSRYAFTPVTNDPDGDNLSFSITNRPDWASFSTTTGTLTGTPDLNDAGTYGNIAIRVSDGSATASLSTFSITVTETNQAPTISGSPATRVAEGSRYAFTPVTNDPDGDNLSFSITNRPDWASFSTTTGTLTGTPDLNDAGTYGNIAIRVSDGSATASLSTFSITVTETNQAPTISGSPATRVAEGSRYAFTPVTNDPDGDNLSFSITNRPDWASFSTTTGTLTGTPDLNDAGTYGNIAIRVSDGSATASLSTFSITVTETNQAPTISGSPATRVAEGSRYAFTPVTNDPDGDNLSFSITNRPDWASFETTTGTLYGAPSFDAAGTYSNIVISVSDGSSTASLGAFSITVTETNQSPIISGIPASNVTVGESYIFRPVASDPDGDHLSFAIVNLPAWASFDSTSGTITGSPDTMDIGLYEDIILSVSDGSAQDALGTISIMVDEAPVTARSATLSWTIPTTRTDGSPLSLSEIDGYRIYMGSNEEDLSLIVDLNDGTTTSHTFTDMAIGTSVFTVTTYDIDGNESSFSNVATKTIM